MGEQTNIAVNKALRAGCRNNLYHLVLLFVLGFTRDGERDVVLVRNVHVGLNHRLDDCGVLHALGLGDNKLLVYNRAGSNGNDSFLFLNVLRLDDIVKLCCNHRDIGYVAIGNHAHGKLADICVLNADFVTAVYASDKLDLSVGNIDRKHIFTS